MTGISTPVELEQDACLGPKIWALPVAGAILYPLLVKGFVSSVAAYQANDLSASRLLLAMAAVGFMALELSVPFLSLRALMSLRNSVEPNAPLLRRVLHVAFATPPVQTLSGFAADAVGLPPNSVWYGGWTMLAAIALLARGTSKTSTDAAVSSAQLRKIHGFSALLLILGFLSLHLANHATALWSVSSQQAVMTLLRGWYRGTWVQPIILGLFGIMIVTGVLLVTRYTAATADRFRTLQTASGAYFAAFIGSHTMAVAYGRAGGIDTNWDFGAGGPLGLLHEPWRGSLIDYYALAVFLIIVHIALGLRIVLLAHKAREDIANRAVYMGAAAGALVTALIMSAALGIHLH